MKDLTKVFIDLSKLSEEELRIVRMTLYKNREYVPFFTNLFEIDHYYKLHYYKGDWLCGDTWYNEKTELSYPDFIKLFEGGKDYPGKRYQPLFDHLNSEHGLILHESEMDEIIRIVGGLNSNQ